MKIKLTLSPEDAAIVHEMYLNDKLDDIGVVGLTVPSEASDKDITLEIGATITLENKHLMKPGSRSPFLGRGVFPITNSPRKVVLEVREEHPGFDDAAFLANLSRILMKKIKATSMWSLYSHGGGTAIEVEMTPPELMRLLKLYKDGHLDDLNIAKIMTVADFFSDDRPIVGGSKDFWKEHYVDMLATGRSIRPEPPGPRRAPRTRNKEEKH